LDCIVGRLGENQHRLLANHVDAFTLSELTDASREPIGRKGLVRPGKDGRHLFKLSNQAKM
jgi:hypothetical protein